MQEPSSSTSLADKTANLGSPSSARSAGVETTPNDTAAITNPNNTINASNHSITSIGPIDDVNDSHPLDPSIPTNPSDPLNNMIQPPYHLVDQSLPYESPNSPNSANSPLMETHSSKSKSKSKSNKSNTSNQSNNHSNHSNHSTNHSPSHSLKESQPEIISYTNPTTNPNTRKGLLTTSDHDNSIPTDPNGSFDDLERPKKRSIIEYAKSALSFHTGGYSKIGTNNDRHNNGNTEIIPLANDNANSMRAGITIGSTGAGMAGGSSGGGGGGNNHLFGGFGGFGHFGVSMGGTGYEGDNEYEFEEEDIDSFGKWRAIGGGCCIFITVTDWVLMSELLQDIEKNYSKPFFLRWSVNAGYMLVIIGWYILKKCNERNANNNDNYNNNNMFSGSSQGGDGVVSFKKPLWRRVLIGSFITNFVGLLSGYLWYESLRTTVASVNNTIYQSQAAFAYVLSAVLLGIAITFQKNLGVLCSLGGVVFVAVGTSGSNKDDDNDSNSVEGLILCVISTILYAMYEVSVKYYGDKLLDQRHLVQDTLYYQFMMGVWTLFTLWPFFFILDWTDIEKFELPKDSKQWMAVGIPVILDLIFTAAFFTGINLTNALIMAMGSLLVIPVTFIVDVIWRGYAITANAVIGSALVFIGFLLMEVPVMKHVRKKLGIKRASIFFSKRNQRVARMKRESLRNETYFEYYK